MQIAPKEKHESTESNPWKLSERERTVLTWAAQGKTEPEIGTILGISQRTVRFHFENARRKAGADRIPLLIEHAKREFKPFNSTKPKKIVTLHTPLSPREGEIIRQFSIGKTDTEIARDLEIERRTLRWHADQAKEKIGVATRIQAAVAVAFGYPVKTKEEALSREGQVWNPSMITLLKKR
jgi:DNA-binding CsgD family transcriptional regulator